MVGTTRCERIHCTKWRTSVLTIRSASTAARWRSLRLAATTRSRSSMWNRYTPSSSPTAASASRGTAMSTIIIGFHRRALTTFFIIAAVRIGARAPVELITTSASVSRRSSWSNGWAWPSISSARAWALSNDRLVTTIRTTPAACRWRAARRDILPAPMTRTEVPRRSPNTRWARSTATVDTLAAPRAMGVSVRTRLAVPNARSTQRASTVPTAPTWPARA